MSEHLDPIRRLETFDSGGVTMTPIAPSEIRRLGNRRRARRRTATVLAAAAAVVAVVVPLGIALGNGSEDGAPPITRTPSPTPSATGSATGSASPAPVITYPDPGVTVRTAADTSALTGTSAAFRSFIASQAEKAAQEGASCPGADHGITVQKYSDAGYATGGVNACGGYVALWVLHGGSWAEGLGTQDAWDCDALAYLAVPSSFIGPCFDESGTFGVPGAGGPEPGMTKAQAEAAGITVYGDAPAPPCSSTGYGSDVITGGDARGLYSPHDGLVQVVMTTNMKTEKGIGLGSPRSKVLAAYPDRQVNSSDLWIVPRPGATAFLVRFGPDHRVVDLTWQLNKADCSGYLM
jgi:hypothetical protein